jgi:NADH-quinone oxidoreductase subunit G
MPAFDRKLAETKCVGCGQCAAVCPTGAITVKNQIGQAWQALHDPKNRVVVQIAPAVRVALGEEFGLPAGENVMDRLVKALKLMGVEEVYDTDFAADMTTISESQEFLERLKAGGPFPMFTSCCPAWVKYLELNDPKYLQNISSCKSPMEMFAAVLRDKYQAKDAADGRRTYHMAIMPCTAKKMEAARAEFTRDGQPDVDLVITTRELVDMIREAGIQLTELEPEAPDLPFGLGSGAAVIYGVTGGVAEAVVRYCLPDKSNNALQAIRVTDLRGDGAIREVKPHRGGPGAAHRHRQRPVPRQGADRRRGGRKAVLSPGRGHDLPGRLRRRRGPALWPDGGEEAPRRGSVRGGQKRPDQEL